MPIEDIAMLVLDVDGVLTDGKMILTAEGDELKHFNCKDGAGIKFLLRAGLDAAIITGRQSRVVEARAKELGIVHVYQNAKEKMPAFSDLLEKSGLAPERVAYMGDDLPDIPVMRAAGLAACPRDAVAEVKDCADIVTEAGGGDGAVREVIERILKAQQKWDGIMSRYR